MAANSELRVFISSTFRDLQEEREHLVKKIFPEIRALCRTRGVTFTDIDLRWGITEEEAEREGIIHICLDEIDRCRPYFIGILGDRYGWTPPHVDVERVADRFPVLGSRLLDGASITEMEIMHGVLANPAMADHAFFYFRDHDATPSEFVDADPDIAGRLRDLKDRIRRSGFPVREDFTSATELGEWLEEDLRRVVDIEHPASETPSPLELERRAHRAFAASRTRAYVANPEYDKRFNEWLTNEGRGVRAEDLRAEGSGLRAEGSGLRAEGSGLRDEELKPMRNPSPLVPQPSPLIPQPSPLVPQPSPLVITAESGLGKSSLIAHLVDEYRLRHPTAFVIEHYVGASQTSGTSTAIMRQIIDEIRERFGIADEAATKPEELERSFPNWLYRGEHDAAQAGIPMIIVIDAVNQLDDAGQRLAWLPRTIPPGIKLMISTTPGASAENLAERAWPCLDVQPIVDEAVRKAIVLRYLGEFHKGITDEQVRRVTTDTKAASPLYLRVVAEELRLHGEHETLDAAIDRHANAVDLIDVFGRVLERIERDYGVDSVRPLMQAVWASRAGLTEPELLEIVGMNRLELSRLLFAVDYHFVQREGLLGFFHDYLRRAVQERYMQEPGDVEAMRRTLAGYFERVEIGERSSKELVRQYGQLSAWMELAGTLCRMERFMALWQRETIDEVVRSWRELGEQGIDVEAGYGASLAAWTPERQQTRIEGLLGVADLYERLSRWDAAADRYAQQRALAEAEGDRGMVGRGYLGVGMIRGLQGRFDEAMEELANARRIFETIGNRSRLASTIGNMGNIYSQRGEDDRALECYAERESICREIGDRRGLASAIGNRGLVHRIRGEYDRAMECLTEQASICRDLGDRRARALAIGNMGVVFVTRGEYDRAVECFTEQTTICLELGDRSGLAYAISNLGSLHWLRGEFDRALERFAEQESICRDLGNRNGVAMAVGNMGLTHLSRGEYDRALEFLAIALAEQRAVGNFPEAITWLVGQAQAFLDVAAHAHDLPPHILTRGPAGSGTDQTPEARRRDALQIARAKASESVELSGRFSMPDTLFGGRVMLARIDAAEGNTGAASERLRVMLGNTHKDEERAELNYWLWKFGNAGHSSAALDLYEALYAKTPKYEYQKRIEECKMGRM